MIEVNGLHHLSDKTVTANDYGMSVMVSHFECVFNVIYSFLNVSGKKYGDMFVTVASAVYSLDIVTL